MMQGLWLISYLVLWGFVLLQTVLLIALVRHIGNLRLWLRQAGVLRDPAAMEEGVPVGTRLEPLAEFLQDRSELSLNHHKAKLLLFVPAGFFGCDDLIPALQKFERQYGEAFQPIIISFEPAVEEQFEVIRRKGIQAPVITEQGWRVAQICEIMTAPYALITDESYEVRAKLPVSDFRGLEELVSTFRQNQPAERK